MYQAKVYKSERDDTCSGVYKWTASILGEILQICIVHERMYFMLERLSGWYREHYRSFGQSACPARENVLVKLGELADYYPLADYFVGHLRMVTLKTHIHLS